MATAVLTSAPRFASVRCGALRTRQPASKRPMVTVAEVKVIQGAAKGFLARCFGTADREEIAVRLARIAEGQELPPERLWKWAQEEVRAEGKRR